MPRSAIVAVLAALLTVAVVPPASAAVSEIPAVTWGAGLIPPRCETTPGYDEQVYALARAGSRVYVGGEFSHASSPAGESQPRPGLFAIDAATGILDPAFLPETGGRVHALAISEDGTKLFVGGRFTRIGGQPRRNLAALDLVTGEAIPGWVADTDGVVWDLAAGDGRLFVGGVFSSPGANLAAVDPGTGATITAWRGSAGDPTPGGATPIVRALKLSSTGTRLYVGGSFNRLTGAGRRHIGALDTTTGAADAFSGRVPPVFDIDVDSQRVYAAVAGQGGEGHALDVVTGRQIWFVHGNGNFQSVGVMGDLVYFGGHFGGDGSNGQGGPGYGGVARYKLAASDAATGAVDDFAPRVNSPLGVYAILVDGADLHIGGTFTKVSGACQPHYARLPATTPSGPGAPAPPTGVTASAGDQSATVTWSAPVDDGGSELTSYQVVPYTGTQAEAPREFLPTETAGVVTGLTNGTPYTFTVAATTKHGAGPESAASPVVVPRTVPGAPTMVEVTAGDGTATVAWAPPASDGGSPVTAYRVTPTAGTQPGAPRLFPPATTAVVDGLVDGTAYTFTVAAVNAAGAGAVSAPSAVVRPGSGYWVLGADGSVHPFGSARAHPETGAAAAAATAGPVMASASVDLAATPSLAGYWTLDAEGRVRTFGDAAHHGDVGPGRLLSGEAAVSLSATPTGAGYWIFTSRGRAFAFGNAPGLGDMGAVSLNGPVLDSVATGSGHGYYMVASDGGIFAFGDAAFHGSMGGVPLNAPVVSLVPAGHGYWLVATDGGVFSFGAPFRGSMGGERLNRPVAGMIRYGDGYLMVALDGGVFSFSDKSFVGSLGDDPPDSPIVAVAAFA